MLRKATPSDAEAIENVRIAAWRAAYPPFMPPAFLAGLETQKNIDDLRKRLSAQSMDFSVTVALRGPSVVAFSILGKPRYDAPPGSIELWALNVLPAYWRQGFGKTLMEHAIGSAITAGFKSIALWCIKGNTAAQAIYEKAGFTLTGQERTSSRLTGKPLHEVHYTKIL
jgi:ribosomal protein S18 acetylase RimI-like enzyme